MGNIFDISEAQEAEFFQASKPHFY